MKKLLIAALLAAGTTLAVAHNCPNEMKAIDAKMAAGPKLSDADKKIFDQVLWEASSRASQDIVDAENRLVAEFEKKGKTVNKVDRAPFAAAVLPSLVAADAPWPKSLYERIQAIK